MKKIKNLSVANIKKIEGMVRREDLDFTDDGNRFRGFSYKGMPITTLRSDDTTYLCIRVDYLDTEFTYKEWMKTEEYRLCDMFNGVSEFDIDELIANLEKVIAKVEEMNAKANEEELDMTEVENAVLNEIARAEDTIEEFKNNFEWYNESHYRLKSLLDYLKSLERNIEVAKSYDFNNFDTNKKRTFVQRLKEYGYVCIAEDNFYIKELKKALNK